MANQRDPGYPVSDPVLHERSPELDFLYSQIQALTTDTDVAAIRALLHATPFREPSALASLRTPTLWLGGMMDLYFPALALPALSSHAPGSQVHLFEKSGHSPYFQEAEVFNQIVGTFLSRHAR